MKLIIEQLDGAFRRAINEAFGVDADPLIALSGNEKFGDYQSNAAMGLAKQLAQRGEKTNPRAVAERIKEKLELGEMADEVSIAGPGFINVKLSAEFLQRGLREVAADERLGVEPAGRPERVVVDYSGPNIAKQMHVGHLRSTIIGDAVARLLAFQGHDVIRQNHLGDWGTQFGRVVLAMWYEVMFSVAGKAAVLDELVAATLRAVQGKNAAAVDAIAVEVQPRHQEFIDHDPDGHVFFEELKNFNVRLDRLERLYQFVSALTDAPAAERLIIRHPLHGERSLAAIPRLTTTFVQNPKGDRNKQEELAWLQARKITIDACNDIYSRLDVQLADPAVQREPIERGESFYKDMLRQTVDDLRSSGVAVESEGAIVVEVEGFESPLIIEKSRHVLPNGEVEPPAYLYGTTDLAAIRFRVGHLGAKRVIYFTDSRQSQHFAQVFATAKKAGWTDGALLEHAPFGTMLGEDGRPFKTRSGEVVRLADLLHEAEERALKLVSEKNPELAEEHRKRIAHAVGIGGVKYSDLSKDRTSDYVFSFDKMLSLEGNTAPYLQYAYARIRSIFRKGATDRAAVADADIRLESPYELALAKHILRLGEIIEIVARELKPHHLTNYLYELATRFSGFYENCPVLQSEEATRCSRLALSDVTARTLALGLELLGIEHPEQM